MRKFLSLVLALVMMMSLVTINAGAKEFSDDGDITYKEAVDVISTIKVVDGYAGGDFKPGNNLTRGAAAKIICNMILGPTTAAELHADTAPYRDVPVTSEFAGYIAYCQKEGIISGYADGSFRPAGTLTGYAFMKMLLGALGYDAEIEGYTGPNWSINVAKRAIGIGLNKSLEKTFNGVEYVTRQEAALYAFNTLKADLVEYDTKITATVNGAEVAIGNSNAKPQEWDSQQTRRDSIYDDTHVQFAEQYFNKLVLTEAMDVFGRPDREWKYDGDEIGAYINMDLFKQEYTTEVTGKQLRDLLGGTVIDEYKFEIHVDGLNTVADKTDLDGNYNNDVFSFTQGNMVRTNTKGIGGTGNGVLTQVFVDNDKEVEKVYIAVINTYLAEAADDYNEKKEEAEFTVYSLEDVDDDNASIVLVKNTNDYKGDDDKAWTTDLKVKNEDITVEDTKDGDIVLVRVADGAIQEILDPEVISETEISSFKNGSWVKADEQYDYADSTTYDPEVLDEYVDNNMKDTTYNLYLDPYGYMIGIEIVEATTNYLFLTGIDGKTSNLANKTAEGNVILLDGTMDTVTIKLNDSRYADDASMVHTETHPLNSLMNTWCKYTVNKSGAYVLTEVAKTAGQFDSTIKKVKAGQSHIGNTEANGVDETAPGTLKFSRYNTIDKKHVSTPGITDSSVKMAYGNDDSVYLSVTTGLITATRVSAGISDTSSAFIIDDVDSVSVGVQNVNLKAFSAYDIWNVAGGGVTGTDTGNIDNVTGNGHDDLQLDSIANGVYNLFDKDGAIIAAVVVGEDDGSTTNYAYSISNSMEQESYDKEKEEYTWSRKVIINGEITEVTEITDGKHPEIEDMARGCWFEMKYKGDGTVKSATMIGWDEDLSNGPITEFVAEKNDTVPANAKFIGRVRKVENAVVAQDTVVLCEDLTRTNASDVPMAADSYFSIKPDARWNANAEIPAGVYKLTTTGNTLWVETKVGDEKDGFAVRNDAKIVLVQDTHVVRNGEVVKTNVMENQYEYSQTGKEALAKVMKDLIDNENFVGFISAVFDGGVATSVVIWDQTPERINTGDDPVAPVEPDDTEMILQIWVTKDYVNEQLPNSSISYTSSNYPSVVSAPDIGAEWVPDAAIKSTPAFINGSTQTVTFNYTQAGDATTKRVDETETPDLPNDLNDGITTTPGKPDEDNNFDKDTWDNAGIVKDTKDGSGTEGQTFVGSDAKTAFENMLKDWGIGIYHYTQEMQDLYGWNTDGTGQVWFQIGPDQDVDEAMILVVDLGAGNSTNGWSLYLDGALVNGTLWNTGDKTGIRFLTWDGIGRGTHTYKFVKNGDGATTQDVVVQWGNFEMT